MWGPQLLPTQELRGKDPHSRGHVGFDSDLPGGAETGASPPSAGPPLEPVTDNEHDTSNQKPGKLGIHVLLAQTVHDQRHPEGQHAGYLKHLTDEEAHEIIHYTSRSALFLSGRIR